MSSDPTPKAKPDDQREALADAEKHASEKQPRSYDERNETDKIVHVDPTDPKSDAAIRGLDPKQKPGSAGR